MGIAGPQSRIVVSISILHPSILTAITTVFLRRYIQTVLLLGYDGMHIMTLFLFNSCVSLDKSGCLCGRLRAAHVISSPFTSSSNWHSNFDITLALD